MTLAMFLLWGAAPLVVAGESGILIRHTELTNSSNPTQSFVAIISNFGDAILEPAVRYRINDAGNLHLLKMQKDSCDTYLNNDEASEATDAPETQCVYKASTEFNTPGKISYTITSGDGFGHTIWTPENKIAAEFWILDRSVTWIEMQPVPDSIGPRIAVNAGIVSSAGDTFFVFADTSERVPFTSAVCVDERCSQTAIVDVGSRRVVDYYVETSNGALFWPSNKTHETFRVLNYKQDAPQKTPHSLSGGEWAGIGIGIAIGVVAIVYGVYVLIRNRGKYSGSAEEKKRFI